MATYDDLMVDIGNAPNDDQGDPLRTAFDKINQRFAELRVFLNYRGDWAPNTVYTANPNRDWVIVDGVGYLATSNHTSGATFAADLAAGKWVEADALLAIQEAQAASDAVDALRADLASTAAGKGAALVAFKQSGAGAVQRTVQDELRDVVKVTQFGADPTGVVDSTAAIQEAISTGKTVVLTDGEYLADSLTQTANDQQFIALGTVVIKRKSGSSSPILFSSGRAPVFRGIKFLGTAGSGDCVVCTGDNPVFDHCSIWTSSGYALWSKGNGARIIGTSDIYYSPDATGSAIAIGVTGTQTYYAQIMGIATSTSAVGVKYFDHGASGISNCQLNKVDMSKGAAYISNCRIVGDYVVAKSFNMIENCTISGNVTLGDGTSLSGIGFGSQVFIQSGSTITVNAGIRESTLHLAHFGSGVTVIDNLTGTATDVENFIFTVPRSYTPTWAAASTNPSLGNGTLTGTYVRTGRTVVDTISLTIGSTTTTGIGEYTFTLSHNPGTRKYIGSAVILDAGSTLYIANMRTKGDGTARVAGFTNSAGTGLQQNSPMIWAVGDTIDATITYSSV